MRAVQDAHPLQLLPCDLTGLTEDQPVREKRQGDIIERVSARPGRQFEVTNPMPLARNSSARASPERSQILTIEKNPSLIRQFYPGREAQQG